MFAETFRQSATDAVKYWERRRIVYNLGLAIVVLLCFWAEYPGSRNALKIDLLLAVFVLAVIANVAYCAAYFVDLFAQATGYRELWQKYRWIVLALGTVFAGVITRFFALGLFQATR